MYGIDYDDLREKLQNIEKLPEYKDLPSIFNDEYYVSSISSSNAMNIRCDANLIGAQLIYYFMYIDKKFKFESYSDKRFTDNVKILIKSEEELNEFLDMINIDYDDFFKILVYVSPTVFTSNLIKFIHKNYLNIENKK